MASQVISRRLVISLTSIHLFRAKRRLYDCIQVMGCTIMEYSEMRIFLVACFTFADILWRAIGVRGVFSNGKLRIKLMR